MLSFKCFFKQFKEEHPQFKNLKLKNYGIKVKGKEGDYLFYGYLNINNISVKSKTETETVYEIICDYVRCDGYCQELATSVEVRETNSKNYSIRNKKAFREWAEEWIEYENKENTDVFIFLMWEYFEHEISAAKRNGEIRTHKVGWQYVPLSEYGEKYLFYPIETGLLELPNTQGKLKADFLNFKKLSKYTDGALDVNRMFGQDDRRILKALKKLDALLENDKVRMIFIYTLMAVSDYNGDNRRISKKGIDEEKREMEQRRLFSVCIFSLDEGKRNTIANLFSNMFTYNDNNLGKIKRNRYTLPANSVVEEVKSRAIYYDVPIIIWNEEKPLTKGAAVVKKIEKNRREGRFCFYPVYISDKAFNVDEIIDISVEEIDLNYTNDELQEIKRVINYLLYGFIEFSMKWINCENEHANSNFKMGVIRVPDLFSNEFASCHQYVNIIWNNWMKIWGYDWTEATCGCEKEIYFQNLFYGGYRFRCYLQQIIDDMDKIGDEYKECMIHIAEKFNPDALKSYFVQLLEKDREQSLKSQDSKVDVTSFVKFVRESSENECTYVRYIVNAESKRIILCAENDEWYKRYSEYAKQRGSSVNDKITLLKCLCELGICKKPSKGYTEKIFKKADSGKQVAGITIYEDKLANYK